LVVLRNYTHIRTLSNSFLRNFYKTGGSVESSEASADLEKELQDKLGI